jgi:hypothetical protein
MVIAPKCNHDAYGEGDNDWLGSADLIAYIEGDDDDDGGYDYAPAA